MPPNMSGQVPKKLGPNPALKPHLDIAVDPEMGKDEGALPYPVLDPFPEIISCHGSRSKDIPGSIRSRTCCPTSITSRSDTPTLIRGLARPAITSSTRDKGHPYPYRAFLGPHQTRGLTWTSISFVVMVHAPCDLLPELHFPLTATRP